MFLLKYKISLHYLFKHLFLESSFFASLFIVTLALSAVISVLFNFGQGIILLLFTFTIFKGIKFSEKLALILLTSLFIFFEILPIAPNTPEYLRKREETRFSDLHLFLSPLFSDGETIDKSGSYLKKGVYKFYSKDHYESSSNLNFALAGSEDSKVRSAIENIIAINFYQSGDTQKSLNYLIKAHKKTWSDQIYYNLSHLLIENKLMKKADLAKAYIDTTGKKFNFPSIFKPSPYRFVYPGKETVFDEFAGSAIILSRLSKYIILAIFLFFLKFFSTRKIDTGKCDSCRSPVVSPFNKSPDENLCMNCFLLHDKRTLFTNFHIEQYEKFRSEKVKQKRNSVLILSLLFPGAGLIIYTNIVVSLLFMTIFYIPIIYSISKLSLFTPAISSTFANSIYNQTIIYVSLLLYILIIFITFIATRRKK